MKKMGNRGSVKLFLGVMLYVLGIGLLVQLLVLPIIFPGLHAGSGLLKGQDPAGFHLQAMELFRSMAVKGWSAWQLRPDGLNAPPGIMAAVYYLVSPHPYVLLPLNGLLWGLTAVVWYQILRRLFPQLGQWAMAGAILVVIFPSSLTWTAQFHKDIFTIPGCSLVLYACVYAFAAEEGGERWASSLAHVTAALVPAILLIWLMRPYLLQLVAAGCFMALAGAVMARLLRRVPTRTVLLAAFITGFIVVSSVIGNRLASEQGAHLDLLRSFETPPPTPFELPGQSLSMREPINGQEPISVKESIGPIDEQVRRIDKIRQGYCSDAWKAGTPIDCDVRLETLSGALAYLPRALQVALLAPFPDTWVRPGKTPGGTQMRLIAGVEMALAYMVFGALVLALLLGRVRPSAPILLAVVWLLAPVLIETYANPNLGTLYRMRYVFWTGLLAISVSLLLCAWKGASRPNRGA